MTFLSSSCRWVPYSRSSVQIQSSLEFAPALKISALRGAYLIFTAPNPDPSFIPFLLNQNDVRNEGQELKSQDCQDGEASFQMLRLSYLTETVLSNIITRNIIVLSFKDSRRKPLRRRPGMTIDSQARALPLQNATLSPSKHQVQVGIGAKIREVYHVDYLYNI